MVAKSFKNENIQKLRKLSDMMCSGLFDTKPDSIYKDLVDEIKGVITQESEFLKSEKSRYKRMKCYENIYNRLEHILNRLKVST